MIARSRARVGAAGVVIAALAASALTGCATASCGGWVHYESPADLARDATLVVVGVASETDETVRLMGVTAAVHEIVVEQVLKGELDELTIGVGSTPDACSYDDSTYYPEGDPLDIDGRAEFFLTTREGGLATLTPFQAAIPIPEGSELPWDPDAPEPTPSPTPTP